MSSHDWTEESIALLGTNIDKKIADILGITTRVVSLKRTQLGIPASGKIPNWTEEESALVGTMPDKDAAERLGRSFNSVVRKRQSMGLPAYKLNRVWIPKNLALLGQIHDSELARRVGISPAAVHTKRKSLGIPPLQPQHGRQAKIEMPITPKDEQFYILNLLNVHRRLTLGELRHKVFFGTHTLIPHVNHLIKTDYVIALDKVPVELSLKQPLSVYVSNNPTYDPNPALPKAQ